MFLNKSNILLLSIGLFLSSMLFLSCSNDYQDILDQVDYSTKPIQQVENIEIVRTDSGQIVYKMLAPIIERYVHLEDDPYELFPKGLEVNTFSNYPKVESSLTCNYAIYKIKQKMWEAKDNVVVVTIEGDTVKTEQMFWDQNLEKIYSDKSVTIRRKDEIIYGIGFESDQSFSNGRIKNVIGTIYIEE